MKRYANSAHFMKQSKMLKYKIKCSIMYVSAQIDLFIMPPCCSGESGCITSGSKKVSVSTRRNKEFKIKLSHVYISTSFPKTVIKRTCW